jgi:hypothetical protein
MHAVEQGAHSCGNYRYRLVPIPRGRQRRLVLASLPLNEKGPAGGTNAAYS